MTLFQKTLGNAAALAAGAVFEAVVQFFFILLASRSLGPVEFGYYGYLITIGMFVSAIVQYGLPVSAVREFARRPEETGAIFGAMVGIRAVLAALSFAAGAVLMLVAAVEPGRTAAVWLLLLSFCFMPFDAAPLFDGLKLSRWDAVGKAAGRILSMGLLIVLWKQGGGLTLTEVVACTALNVLVYCATGWLISGRVHARPKTVFSVNVARGLLKLSTPLMWSGLMTMIFLYSQTLLVKWLSSDLETGYYALANRVLMPVLIVQGILYRLALPILAEVDQDRESVTARLEKIIPALGLVFMPGAALGIAAADGLLVPIFGEAYAGAVLPLQISLGFIFFTGALGMLGTAMITSGRQKAYSVSLTVGSTSSVLLGLLLIPRGGAAGAALATLGAQALTVSFQWPFFRKDYNPRIWLRLGRIAAAAVAAPVVYGLLTIWTSLPRAGALAAAGGTVILGLWLAREITAERIRQLSGLVRGKA